MSAPEELRPPRLRPGAPGSRPLDLGRTDGAEGAGGAGGGLGSRVRALAGATSPRAVAVRGALETAIFTRALVTIAALYAALSLSLNQRGRQDLLPDGRESPLLHPFTENPLGPAAGLVFEPLARWDAGWYLGIANGGYADGPGNVFFPVYPLLVWLVSGTAYSFGYLMVAAYAVSTAAFLGALYVLHRLVELELGRPFARPALLLLAIFPGSLYFGAPYSESMFLLVTISSFYAARTGRWAWAGILAGVASGTRSVGILLIVPLLVLYLYGPREDRPPDRGAGWRPRYRLRPNVLWLGLFPAGLIAFCVHLNARTGDPFSWATYQRTFWGRSLGFPLEQVWTGTRAGLRGLLELVRGFRNEPVPGFPYDLEALYVQNLVLLGFLVFALVATVGTLRRLPLAYGAWAVAVLGVPLSYSVAIQPLLAFQRYVSVVFPLFIWLAIVGEERRLTHKLAIASAVLLGVFTAQFSTWHWFV